jgi:uncharacterized protein (UPF0261 family)
MQNDEVHFETMAPVRNAVAVVATLDTKGEEVRFVSEALSANKRPYVIFDIGTSGPYRSRLSLSDGASPADILSAIAKLAKAELVAKCETGEITAVLGIAGGKGSATFGAIVGDLPYGFPRLLISSARPALLAELATHSDMLLYPTLVDLFGINHFTERVLTNAVNAVSGMRFEKQKRTRRKTIALTAFGVTTPAASACAERLRSAGFDAVVFPANGAGGRTMEQLIDAGEFDGVIDLTTTELADELVGGTASAGADRLTAASKRGVPQVIAPGAVDMVNFGSKGTVPTKFQDRKFFSHTPYTTLMRTTPEENREIGRMVGLRVGSSAAPVRVLWPSLGVSDYDRDGAVFFDRAADKAWLDGVRETLPSSVPVIELDCHINDVAFADAAASWMIQQLS